MNLVVVVIINSESLGMRPHESSLSQLPVEQRCRLAFTAQGPWLESRLTQICLILVPGQGRDRLNEGADRLVGMTTMGIG